MNIRLQYTKEMWIYSYILTQLISLFQPYFDFNFQNASKKRKISSFLVSTFHFTLQEPACFPQILDYSLQFKCLKKKKGGVLLSLFTHLPTDWLEVLSGCSSGRPVCTFLRFVACHGRSMLWNPNKEHATEATVRHEEPPESRNSKGVISSFLTHPDWFFCPYCNTLFFLFFEFPSSNTCWICFLSLPFTSLFNTVTDCVH